MQELEPVLPVPRSGGPIRYLRKVGIDLKMVGMLSKVVLDSVCALATPWKQVWRQTR